MAGDDFEHGQHIAAALCARALERLPLAFDSDDFLQAVAPMVFVGMEVGVTFARRYPEEAERWVMEYVPAILREAGALTEPVEVRERNMADQARRLARGCDTEEDPL